MQLGNVITAFSNQTLHAPSVPTWLQKHSLLLVLWHLIPPSPLPPPGPLCAGRAQSKVRWKVWGKPCARKHHPCPRCGSPYPTTLSHPGKGSLQWCCKLGKTQTSGQGSPCSGSQPTGVPVHPEQVPAERAVFLTIYTSFTARAAPTSSTSPYNTEQILSFKLSLSLSPPKILNFHFGSVTNNCHF